MAITVTATQGGTTANGLALRVFVLTQAAATQNGATANAAINSSTAFTASITTTQTGSRVYGAAANGSNSSFSAAASTTLVDDIADATNTERYGTFKATSLTGTPGATILGLTAAAASTGPLAMAEIKTAGTLTEDGSAPAVASTTSATTVTTASFTPPGGSLLVALVASDGGAGVTTMTVSGGGLTWTEQVKNNPSAGDYAGVWIAQVAAGSAFVPLQPSRRLPYRAPALPSVRRYRSLLPVPAQLNPPYPFAETVQRRETWPRGMPRRGRVTFVVPPQLNPPYPFTGLAQRRETWARGLPRRGRQVTPVPAQLNPPFLFAEIRQWRQPRGLWPRRGHRFEPVPAQQAAASAPAFTWQPLRHARIMLSRRGRAPVVVPGQDAPVAQARRTRPAVPARRPSRQTLPVPAQLNPPWPAAEITQRRQAHPRALQRRGRVAQTPQAQAPAAPPAWVQSHRVPLRALALIRRRFAQLLPWPQATAPAFSIGVLTAGDKAAAQLTAAAAAPGILTTATASTAALTAGDQRTGGPS